MRYQVMMGLKQRGADAEPRNPPESDGDTLLEPPESAGNEALGRCSSASTPPNPTLPAPQPRRVPARRGGSRGIRNPTKPIPDRLSVVPQRIRKEHKVSPFAAHFEQELAPDFLYDIPQNVGGKCWNHGLSVSKADNHKMKCQFVECQCELCKHVKTRDPMCSKCGAHGFKIRLIGHKRHCRFRYCNCDKCILVDMRRKVMKCQVALRRYHDNEKLRAERGDPPASEEPVFQDDSLAKDLMDIPSVRKRKRSQSPVLQSPELSSGNMMTPTPTPAINLNEVPAVEESLKKIASYFGQRPQTFLYALYITILKQTGLNCDLAISKILDGEKELNQLNLKFPTPVAPSPPSNYCSPYYSSSSPSSSLIHTSAFHPMTYSQPLIQSYPYSLPSPFPNSSGLGHHSALEQPSPSMLPLSYYYPAIPYAQSTPGVLTPSTITSEFRSSPAVVPSDSPEGNRGGSAECTVKEDSDKESPSTVVEPHLPRPINLTNAAYQDLRMGIGLKSSKNHMPFEHYHISSFRDRRETAANA